MLKDNPSILDVRRYAHSCKRKQRRKTIRIVKAHAEHETKLGRFYHVKTMTGLVPYNSKGQTTYLIGGGITCIGERTKSGYRIYLNGGRIVKSKKDLLQLIEDRSIPKPVIARRFELKVGNQIVMGE